MAWLIRSRRGCTCGACAKNGDRTEDAACDDVPLDLGEPPRGHHVHPTRLHIHGGIQRQPPVAMVGPAPESRSSRPHRTRRHAAADSEDHGWVVIAGFRGHAGLTAARSRQDNSHQCNKGQRVGSIGFLPFPRSIQYTLNLYITGDDRLLGQGPVRPSTNAAPVSGCRRSPARRCAWLR